MASKKKKRKPGRPEIPLDWGLIDRMLAAHCTGTEIAETLGVHHETIYNQCERHHGMSFTDYSVRKRKKGKVALKMTMFQLAMGQEESQNGVPDKSMLIWLSKNLLGFSDRSEHIIPLQDFEPGQEEEQQGVVIVLPPNNRD
jgi:hypothetical protein